MNKNKQDNKKLRWLILVLPLVILIGVIIAVQITRKNQLFESTSGEPTTHNIPTKTISVQSELTNDATQDISTPKITTSTGSIPEDLSTQMTYEVIQTYPHDPGAFTQGLIIHEGFFYESTGLYGQSSLRKVVIESGEVLQQSDLPSEYFGEGLTIWEDNLVQLTWRENVGFVYDLADFSLKDQFTYSTEGWGLTHNGSDLIKSDGSATLFFLDPETYQITDRITVTYRNDPVNRLNELEFINGEIFANIWQTDNIVRIDPQTGNVLSWIDLAGILAEDSTTANTDVLNGIAYEAETNRLFVTGKNWPFVFEIRLVPQS